MNVINLYTENIIQQQYHILMSASLSNILFVIKFVISNIVLGINSSYVTYLYKIPRPANPYHGGSLRLQTMLDSSLYVFGITIININICYIKYGPIFDDVPKL